MTPSSSNCQTTSTISNGVALELLGITGASSGPGVSSGPTASGPKVTGTGTGGFHLPVHTIHPVELTSTPILSCRAICTDRFIEQFK